MGNTPCEGAQLARDMLGKSVQLCVHICICGCVHIHGMYVFAHCMHVFLYEYVLHTCGYVLCVLIYTGMYYISMTMCVLCVYATVWGSEL